MLNDRPMPFAKTFQILFFAALISIAASSSQAQSFQKNFLGEGFLSYKGVLFQINPDATPAAMSYALYPNLKFCKLTYSDSIAFPEKQYKSRTDKAALAGKTFRVINLVDKNGDAYDEITSAAEKPIIILEDTLTKEVFYYKYDNRSEANFAFLTSPIPYDEQQMCTKVSRKLDEFTQQIQVNSPATINGMPARVNLNKQIDKGAIIYSLTLISNSNSNTLGGSGVDVLFADGSKWTKPLKVKMSVAKDGGYEYSCSIGLTTAELMSLAGKNIKKFRLATLEQNVSIPEAEQFKIFVKCVKNTK